MVDKTTPESTDKSTATSAQKSSEELFLRGSDKDELLRKKADDENLKLEDSQEEVFLQNIQRGSEQSENPKLGATGETITDASALGASEGGEVHSQNSAEINSKGIVETDRIADVSNDIVNGVNDQSEKSDNENVRQASFSGNNEVIGNAEKQTLSDSAEVVQTGNETIFVDTEERTETNNSANEVFNTAPDAGDDVAVDVAEGESIIEGKLLATDADIGELLEYQIADGINLPDGFLLAEDGTWKFDAQVDTYNHLGEGDVVVLTIPVVVSDEHGATDTVQIQITVNGTNDAPVAGAAVSTDVGEGALTISGQLNSTDVDDGASSTWSVSSGSSVPDGFILNADGFYSFDSSDESYNHLNVGDSVTLTIPVTVTDDNGATDTSQIQITVSGTNDAPVAGASVVANIDEGSALISGQLTATDIDDGATITFTITEGSNAPDGFVLNADGSYSFDPADSTYDHLNTGDSEVLTIPITVTDEKGETDTTQIEITVSGSNDAPTAIVVTGGVVDENAAGNTVVAQMTTQDVDDGESFTYSIADDPSGLFEVSGDQIVVKDGADIDFETAESHAVNIQVTDANGSTYTQSVTFTVNDVNEGPVNVELNNLQINEISSDSEQITLGDFGNGVVAQDGASGTGYLMLSEENVHDRFSDNSIHSQSADNLVTVKNIEGEWFYDTNTQYIPFTPEPGDRLVAELDFSNDTATLMSGITDPTNQIEGINAGYVDGDFSITVNQWGGNNNAGEFGVSGTHLNVAPDVNLTVGTVSASDAEGDALSYSLTDNSDGAFQIDSQTGDISISDVSKIDFEDAQSHDVTVEVSDGNGGVTEQVFTIQLNDVNEAANLLDDTAAVNENGSVTVDVLANDSDPDAGDHINLDQASITSGNGQVSIVDGKLVFDANGEYDSLAEGEQTTVEINYTVVDDAGLSSQATVHIDVTGSNDAPEYHFVSDGQVAVDVGDINNGIVAQDDARGTGYLMLSEENVHDRFSDNPIHSQSADNLVTVKNIEGEWFYDTNTQYIPFTPEPGDRLIAELDFSNDDATLLSGVTDPNNQIEGINAGYSDGDISINVNQWGGNNNAGEFGVSGSVINIPNAVQQTSIAETISDGTPVATVVASDAEGDTLQFTLLDNSGGRFTIDANTGEISVADASAINFEDASEHQVNVQISDGNGGVTEQSITIDVTDVNEASTDIELSNNAVDENSVGGTVVATLSTIDEDSAETFSYTLNDDSGLFEVSGDQIVVKDGVDIDFESAQEHNISVEVTDSAGNTYSEEFTINVNDIVENVAPVAVNDVADSFTPENASLTAEINFDGGVPSASLGSVTTEANGQVGDAADFSSAKVEVNGLALNGDAGAQTTVSMWIQGNPEGGWEMLAASDRYDMVMSNGDIGFNTAQGDMFGTDASELADGEWHHIVGVFTNGDVSQNTIHIDGVEQEMSQIRGTPNNSAANIDSSDGSLHFGSWGANDNYRFSGSMDEVKVYDGVLSNDEVTQLYEIEADNLSWNGGALSAQEDTALTINATELLANDTDADGDALTISAVEAGEHGTVELDAEGNVVFTPEENYNGEASFSYTVSDGKGGEDTATVTLNVSSANDVPTIDVVNTITVDEDGSQQFTYNVSDIDSTDVVLTGESENGNVVVNGDGTVTFTPNEDYFGDDTIVLTATDSNGGVSTQEISVTINPIEDAPDAVSDGSFEPESATLTADINFDSGVPTALVGSVAAESSGQVGDAADFSSAKVEVSDLALNGDAGAQTTVSMWIQGDPEGGWEMLAASDRYDMVMSNGDIGFNTAQGDMFGTDASELADGEWHHIVGVFTNGDVSQNTIHIDGVAQEMSQIRGTPNNNAANIDSSDGSLHFGSWGANDNYRFSGSMDEVKVYDGALSNDEIGQLHDIESANIKWDGTSLQTEEDVTLVIDPTSLLANDKDVDGDVISLVSVQDAENGTVEIDAEGNVAFTPAENYNGEASFSYTIDDGKGNTDTTTVTINVVSDSAEGDVNSVNGTAGDDNLVGTSGNDYIVGQGGDDVLYGGAGDDILVGGAGNDSAAGGEGNDTYVMNPFEGSDYFSGGEGGGWTDAIDISAMAANDSDNPWTIEVDGAQVEYDLAAGALEMNGDTAGVISFGDGSELSFEGVERIEW